MTLNAVVFILYILFVSVVLYEICVQIFFFSLLFFSVLAASVSGYGPGNDASRVLCPDTPSLLDQEVAEAALSHLLHCSGIWPHPYHPLDLA